MTELRFDERVAVITGAGRGLGRAYAELLAARGATVIVNDVGPGRDSASAGSADEVVAAIRARGGTAVPDHHDIADRASAVAVAESALDRFGRVDVFIHNAGSPIATLDDHLKVVMGGAWIAGALWSSMAGRSYGRILTTSSGVGIFGNGRKPDFGEMELYGIAKMGEVGLARHLAVRGSSVNITANVIVPMAYTQALVAAAEHYSESPRMAWVRENCTVDAVAPVAAWLVHEDCPSSGEIFRAAGGRVARIFVAETPGASLSPTLSIEDVRDHFEAIRDERGYVIPERSDQSPGVPAAAP